MNKGMKATITKGWELYYIDGATMHEFQIRRLCVSFLKFRYWFRPRRHFATGRWEFPRLVRCHVEKGDDGD